MFLNELDDWTGALLLAIAERDEIRSALTHERVNPFGSLPGNIDTCFPHRGHGVRVQRRYDKSFQSKETVLSGGSSKNPHLHRRTIARGSIALLRVQHSA